MSTKHSDSGADTSPDTSPQSVVSKHLTNARALQRQGRKETVVALATLEKAMSVARSTPYEIEFQTRVDLALTLGDLYVTSNDIEKARRVLREEADFAEMVFQALQASGTTEQKRAAAGGRVQIRDRARQVALIGEPAPEIEVKDWIKGEPATLADLRGRVVLLEFWATWCKPCQEMFPKLKQLDEQHRDRGFEVIALTRHYFAGRDTASSLEDELELMRGVVAKHALEFRVGVAEDERTQDVYGATGMPTLALVDRNGLVQYAHFGGGEDPRFELSLERCLSENQSG